MLIRRFEDIQKTDLPLVGGKGLNLGLLVKAGFRVPDGFCLTTQAHRIVGTRRAVPLPGDVVSEILDAYSYLGGGR